MTEKSAAKETQVAILGAGLAGCEAALQLAKQGLRVRLHDLKPTKRSPAHHSNNLAEIVCSNSFGSQGPTAAGLLKQELTTLGCELLKIAKSVQVPAGKALAVDREAFAAAVTARIQAEPLIDFVGEEATGFPDDVQATIMATGPLTTEPLAQALAQVMGRDRLYFFDAAAPIVTRDSINMDVAFVQDRYNSQSEGSDEASYINCPLNKEQYEALVAFLLEAEKTPLKAFESQDLEAESSQKTTFFESCMPVEVIASRGPETLRYGPMKPVGLTNPHSEERPYAVVQLRQDNAAGTLYNLVGFQTNVKWGPQKTMVQMIPGLEDAEVVRYGVMHRNTFIHSPEVLQPTLQLKQQPNILVAGQLTGTEGYSESIATGLMAARVAASLVRQQPVTAPPPETMLGALLAYITRPEAVGKSFQPINSNWGILPPLAQRIKSKKDRAVAYAERAEQALAGWLE